MLVDIVMNDLSPMLEGCFVDGWVTGNALAEIVLTVDDYFGDFHKFLYKFFFQRLALMVLQRVRASCYHVCSKCGVLTVCT